MRAPCTLLTFVERVLLKTFQNRSVSSPAPVTMASPSGDMAYRGDKRDLVVSSCSRQVLRPRQKPGRSQGTHPELRVQDTKVPAAVGLSPGFPSWAYQAAGTPALLLDRGHVVCEAWWGGSSTSHIPG